MTEFLECQGITLASYPLKEADSLIHLFSKQRGVIKLVLPRANRLRSRLHPFAEPLVEGEFTYKEGRSDLFRCQEAHLLHSSLHLRKSLSVLEAALAMTSAVHRSQMLWKPAPLLYQLFSTYLRHLNEAQDAATMLASFYLKLLKHEGHLQLRTDCALCQKPIDNSFYLDGELYCSSHQPLGGVTFDDLETLYLIQLSEERQLEKLLSITIEGALHEKIKLIFGISINERTVAKGGT